jgi:uncharacterized protein YkwD
MRRAETCERRDFIIEGELSLAGVVSGNGRKPPRSGRFSSQPDTVARERSRASMQRNDDWTAPIATSSRRRAGFARALAWVLLGLAACASRQSPGPSVSAPVALDVAYDTAETRPAVLGAADEAAIEQAVDEAARDAGLLLRGDGRLARLAQLSGSESAERELLAHARVLGVVETAIELHRIEPSAGESLASALTAQLREPLRAGKATHFGVFVQSGGSAGRVVLSRRPFTLAPIARRYPVGGSVIVRGRLEPPYRNPKLVASGPSGAFTLPAGEGPELELHVPLKDAGSYRIALHARDGERVEALAEVIVSAGVAPSAASQASTAQTPAQLQSALYARTAALRAAHALPPLSLDAALQVRAERDSAALAAGAAVEALPVQRGGLALRTVARGADETALWSALVADGGLRTQLLSSDVTHVGIGVSAVPGGFVATHVLARLALAVDDDLAPARVLAALNTHRVSRAAPALRPDPQLTRVAHDAAHELFAHPERSEREILDQAERQLDRFRLTYARVAALAVVVLDPLEAAALEPALDPAARAVGIAVVRGERPDSSPGSVAVVLALGWDRAQ